MQNTAYRFYRQVQENTAAKCRRKSHRRPAAAAAAAAAAAKRPSRPLALSPAARVACAAGLPDRLAAPRRGHARRPPSSRRQRPGPRRPRPGGRAPPPAARAHQAYPSPCRYMPGILSSAVEFCEGAPCKNSQASDLSKLHKRLEDNFVKNQAHPSTLNRLPPPRRRAAAPLRRRAAPTAYSVTPPQPTAPRPRLALTACACVYRATSTTIL